MSTPDPFLTPGAATNTISSSAGWKNVLDSEKLSPTATADADITVTREGSKLGNISISNTALQDVVYASDGNYSYFIQTEPDAIIPDTGPPPPAYNAAWLGDENGSAVLLLQNPGTTPVPQSLRGLLTAFHVDPSDGSSKINTFIKAVDKADALKITVNQPAATASVEDRSPTSGLWCVPTDDSYTILQRLTVTAALGNVIDDVAKWISGELGIGIDETAFSNLNIKITISSTTVYPIQGGGSPQSTTVASFGFDMGRLRLFVDLTKSSVKLTVTPQSAIDLVSMVKMAFKTAAGAPTGYMPDKNASSDPVVQMLGNLIYPWYLDVAHDDSGGGLSWGVGVLIVIKTTRGGGPIVFGLAFDSATSTFFGQLLTKSYFLDGRNLRSPTYDARLSAHDIVLGALGVSDIRVVQDGVDLWTLIAPDSTPPKYIPHLLTNCGVMLTPSNTSDATKSSTFQFTATLKAFGGEVQPAGDGSDGTAPTGFVWKDCNISAIMRSTSDKPTIYTVSIASNFTLTPPAGSTERPATLWAKVIYDNSSGASSWLISADLENLSVGLIASFFDKDTKSGAMAVLDKLTLTTLSIRFAHTGGQPSSFWIYGVLVLGELELDLSYQYVGRNVGKDDQTAYQAVTSGQGGGDGGDPDGGSDPGLPQNPPSKVLAGGGGDNAYLFEAYLRTTSSASTLGSIMESIVPGSSASLPGFVSGIQVDPTGKGSTPAAALTFSNSSTKGSTLCVLVNIAGFSFTFVQFKTIASEDPKIPASTKRILRFECDKIPMIDKVPVINALPQPFDSLEYVWVADDQTIDDRKGITKGDIGNMPGSIPAIQYKQAKQQEKDPDVVLAVGHHFIVVAHGKVVLDHVFGSAAAAPATDSTKKPAADLKLAGPRVARLAAAPRQLSAGDDPDASTEAKPTKGAAVLQVGPLSVTAIGLQVASGHLLVSLDATLSLGGLSMSVIGFTIGIDLSTIHLNDLSSLTLQDVGSTLEKLKVSLAGLAVGIERGPLTLAGVFEHKDDPVAEVYRGGIAVGFEAWQVLAVGEYKIVHATSTTSDYRAVFVYGKLDGPLVELEFATISGVRLGFGYNYSVRMPSVNELYQFPFISDAAASGAGNDPMAVLNAMTAGSDPFVYPKQNSLWFCAGMSITALGMFTATAVLMFDMTVPGAGNDQYGVVMAMLGDGIFQMEPEAPPDLTLFYVEIVLKEELNFTQGYVAVDAALAPTSHVYVPQAHLSGQAAFYYWFPPSPHFGDWVASMGGYARNYTPAPHYPVPDRLMLSFTVGDNIQIVGTGYVAVTPKCAMAGGTLHMSLSVGPVSAYADIIMDAYINFKPFHFRAYIGLSVGVECDIDILFIHIHVSVHLGADLILWGPHDFGGWAHIDFWFFGFDISFGADENADAKKPISLDDFLALVRTPGPDAEVRSTDSVSSDPTQADVAIHKWTVEQGLMPAKTPAAPEDGTYPSTGTNYEWQVDGATLVMRVDTVFALTAAQLATDATGGTSPIGPIDTKTTGAIYAMPMHSLTAATSSLTITVMKGTEVQTKWRAEVVVKSGAAAMWSHAPWTSANDPLSVPDGNPPPATVTDGTSGAKVDVVLGVRLLAPEPVRARSQVVQFDIAAAMLKDLDAAKNVVVVEDDRAFDCVVFEPDETDQVKRWQDFGAVMAAKTNAASLQLDAVRAAMTANIADVLEWAIRPVSAGADDPDADGGWMLKGVSPDALAADVATQWGELPFVSPVA